MNVKAVQAKVLGGRRSRLDSGLPRGGGLPKVSSRLNNGGVVAGKVVKTNPWHPVHGPLLQQPRPQSASSDDCDGADAAVRSALMGASVFAAVTGCAGASVVLTAGA